MPEHHFLIITRFPTPGKVKTRLIPALGPQGAARLQRRMTEQIVGLVRETRKKSPKDTVQITVSSTGASPRDFRTWLGRDLEYESQSSGDLGTRLNRAFASAFRNGAKSALAMGTDVPDLSAGILSQAVVNLGRSDVVLGPAMDGGYYLIGLRRPTPELFAGIDWGSDQVCAQTRVAAAALGLEVSDLPMLHDVDRPEDVAPLRINPLFADVFTNKSLVSVIIPTLNEADALGRVLSRVQNADMVEVIVADGGSQDETRRLAGEAGALVLEVPGGRAAQLNAGAEAANGRLLLFLHADTLVPENFPALVREAMENPLTVGGAFRFQTDGTAPGLRLVEWATNLRSSLLQWPYGDQGLFLEKRVFREMGGFSPLPIMEDFEFIKRLRRRGRIVTLDIPAVTSARRWEQLGLLRTTMINQTMVAGYWCGIPIHRLNRLYRHGSRPSGGNHERE